MSQPRAAHEHELEPIPGLPAQLPEGEQILWQGRPSWRSIASQTFKLRWIALYFAFFVVGRAVYAVHHGEGAVGAAHVVASFLLSLVGVGIFVGLAWFNARATLYTITNRRVVLRTGVAIPITWNLPFAQLAAADIAELDDKGLGNIALHLTPAGKVGWLFLWPHVQPGHFRRPRPMMLGLEDASAAAAVLKGAVQAWGEDRAVKIRTETPTAVTAPHFEVAPST
ncbi:MAG: photosynthetic complex putative assembly protein PuhB [Myxococcota bacterium]